MDMITKGDDVNMMEFKGDYLSSILSQLNSI
jgi:hypothetical protein